MPITSGMEQIIVMCTSHLLVEARLDDQYDARNANLDENFVCDMTAISATLNNFANVVSNMS